MSANGGLPCFAVFKALRAASACANRWCKAAVAVAAWASERTTKRRSVQVRVRPATVAVSCSAHTGTRRDFRRRGAGLVTVDRRQRLLLRPYRLQISVDGGLRELGQRQGRRIMIAARGQMGPRRQRHQLAVTHVRARPRRPTPVRTWSIAGMYSGSSAFSPDTTCVAGGNPNGSRVANMTFTWGRSAR